MTSKVSAQMRAFFENMAGMGFKLTYDDVRLQTQHSEILPADADLSSRFSRRIRLRIPIVSSPMDTVTTASMAIAMAEAGGIGTIHRGLSPKEQAKEVQKVKHRLHGRINTPITVKPDDTVASVLNMCQERGFLFRTFPVIDGMGAMVGLVTGNDFDFCVDVTQQISAIMTPFDHLTVADPSWTHAQVYQTMLKHKKKVLPLVGEVQQIAGMFLFSDLRRIFTDAPGHNLDQNGQLLVGAAVGTGGGAYERAGLLAGKGCDVFIIDTAHGDSKGVLETIAELKRIHPDVDVVAGNVSSGGSARRLVDAGVDGVLVGQGPGSICTTRVVAGIGVPQVSAVYECAAALAGTDVPVCADGGINSSGDMVLALAVGASSVMLGRLLAGTEESPGETRIVQGMQVKDYRGMGSLGAMKKNPASRDKYGQEKQSKLVPEGVEGIVPYRGRVADLLTQFVGGIGAGMAYNGARTLAELRERAEIFRVTGAGLREGHPHDIAITTAAPNYEGR